MAVMEEFKADHSVLYIGNKEQVFLFLAQHHFLQLFLATAKLQEVLPILILM